MLKRDRVAARLLANFGFTHVQRSSTACSMRFDRPALNVTLLVRATDARRLSSGRLGRTEINVAYGAMTRQLGSGPNSGEWRLFGLAYSDRRDGVSKTDNRPLAARQRDRDHVNVSTFGGHYIRAIEGSRATIDVLLWGAAQTGSWGELAHRAGAFAAEAGWQPRSRLAPWIRGGLDYASGDAIRPTRRTAHSFRCCRRRDCTRASRSST